MFANTDWYLYNFRRSLIVALGNAGHDLILVSPPGPFSNHFQEMGYRWLPAPMKRRSLNPLREIELVRWLWRLMAREKIDLVHSFTIKCAVYGSLAGRLAQIPARVNAIAGMGYVFTSDSIMSRMLRPVVRLAMRLALGGPGTCLILQNPDDVALFEQFGLIDGSLIRLVPGSGVDCLRFHPRDLVQRAAGDARLRVLLPARLLWDKGVAEFVDAARILHAEGRAIDFLLAGEPDPGNPAAVPTAMIQGWVADGLVDWLGHVHDMPGLFNSVDVVVLPSYREGLPKGLIEAAACGKPLIATDAPGCREVVTHELDGLLIPVRDAYGLAQAIRRLQDDQGLCRRLGSAARIKALATFDESIIISQTLAVYQELMGPTVEDLKIGAEE